MSYNKEVLLQLPIEENISLVTELWDSIAEQQIPLPEWKKTLIKERIAADKSNLNGSSEWNILKGKYAR